MARTTVEDAAGALAAWERKQHGVAICDLDLPGVNGVELAQVLRQRSLGMVLLTFTGSSGSEQRAGGGGKTV